MTELMEGIPLERAEEFIALFKETMLDKNKEVEWPEDMEELEALKGVRRYPVRIKCALLPWNTLLEALAIARRGGGKAEPVSTE